MAVTTMALEAHKHLVGIHPALQQHQRQPQREQHAHDDDGDEAHRAAGAHYGFT